ncbi:helix-turn-helix domain-containing protein [Lactococcus lactis]|uniref:Helix-turn-helix domain-containing protein n=2 Tax=Lactococcus lactis TaxID=1358 RepID=A0AB35KGR2_9LACT|nr:helix-turn-helix transcriptional regulator [Lactococcus lactis]KST84206.1 hypothetical protein LK337_0954 [Lactococcus lactis subsp. lactis]MCQ4972522.1 helix-turn-helix domain-containing protein [Lactococcus lactis]MCQ4998328.1 helix-turn-helix domain-containing protein [Lactococcus lactis]MDG4979864.1 helix-turn-helix domain-containing protein [Lactococcus lactis]MDG5049788.1 helix-turn-helix domain-containing protein [Lactococcus lactis]
MGVWKEGFELASRELVESLGITVVDPDYEWVSKKMKTLRGLHGLTQQELGDRIGQSKQSIYNYENGKKEPTIKTLYKIAGALDIDFEDLIGDTGKFISESGEHELGTPEYLFYDLLTKLGRYVGGKKIINSYLESDKVDITEINYFLSVYDVPKSVYKTMTLQQKKKYLQYKMQEMIDDISEKLGKLVLEKKPDEISMHWEDFNPYEKQEHGDEAKD